MNCPNPATPCLAAVGEGEKCCLPDMPAVQVVLGRLGQPVEPSPAWGLPRGPRRTPGRSRRYLTSSSLQGLAHGASALSTRPAIGSKSARKWTVLLTTTTRCSAGSMPRCVKIARSRHWQRLEPTTTRTSAPLSSTLSTAVGPRSATEPRAGPWCRTWRRPPGCLARRRSRRACPTPRTWLPAPPRRAASGRRETTPRPLRGRSSSARLPRFSWRVVWSLALPLFDSMPSSLRH